MLSLDDIKQEGREMTWSILYFKKLPLLLYGEWLREKEDGVKGSRQDVPGGTPASEHGVLRGEGGSRARKKQVNQNDLVMG